MGINEGSLQVIDEGDNGKFTNIITLRYMFTSSAYCGVCNSHYILHL